MTLAKWYQVGTSPEVFRNTRGQAGGVQMEIRRTGDFGKILRGFEKSLRNEILEDALYGAGRIVKSQAEKEAPDSRTTGYTPREKKKKYAGTPHLKKTIRIKVSPKGKSVGMWVGPRWPSGAHGNMVEGFPKATKHYAGGSAKKGKPNRWTGDYNKPNPFMHRAVHKTRAKQDRVILNALMLGAEMHKTRKLK